MVPDDHEGVLAHALWKCASALTAVPVTQLDTQPKLLERLVLKKISIPNLSVHVEPNSRIHETKDAPELHVEEA